MAVLLGVVGTVGGATFAAIWGASVIWAVRDASRRCANPRLRLAVAVGAIVFPVVGAAVYALARPCDDRIERRSQRLRIALLEAALEGSNGAERCSACSEPLEPEFRCCPGCGEPAHTRCEGCESFVRATWTACPWCAEPIAPAAYAKIRRSSRARGVAA